MKTCFFIFIVTFYFFAKANSFLDQNFRVGAGFSYSKLESPSLSGSYYLVSSANPRLELSYDAGIKKSIRQRYSFSATSETYQSANAALFLKTASPQYNFALWWQPMWVSEGELLAYGFKFGAKTATVISELPNPAVSRGDIAARYSAEGGVCISWFGQTVSRLPLGVNFEALYSQTLLTNSDLTYYNGMVYRLSVEFDFKKKNIFSNWNTKLYYSYEDVETGFNRFAEKDLGFSISKIFVF